MAFLGNIVKNIEKNLKIKVHGKYDPNKFIEGVRIITEDIDKNKVFEENLLYLINGKEKIDDIVNNYQFLVINTNEKIINTLTIKEEISVENIVNLVEEEIILYDRKKDKRIMLFEALFAGHGLKYLLKTAYLYLGNPITLCDTSFSVMESIPKLDDYEKFDEFNGKLFLKEEKIKNMKDANIIEHISNLDSALVTKLDDSKTTLVFQAVKIKDNTVAYLFTQDTEKEIVQEDIEYLEVLSQMVSIELQKDTAFNKSAGYKFEYFLTQILEGHLDNSEQAIKQLILLGHKPSPYYQLLACKFTKTDSSILDKHHYLNQLKNIIPESLVMYFKDCLVALIPRNTTNSIVENTKNKLKTFLNLNNLYGATSYVFDDILLSRNHFDNINGILKMNSIRRKKGDLLDYKDFYLYHILGESIEKDKVLTYIHPHIICMEKFDKENKTDYINTLSQYIRSNRNAASASNALFIHKSTFFYRINKMNELFNIEIENPELMFNYELSLRVLKYIELNMINKIVQDGEIENLDQE